ncbi:hypothetical protein ACL02U_02260 [Streptomyces sp. MS06]|uniref:hypothetical protein n=1 Tax=Streptomyces sp. MS06 TaxID=3385974 RepID=UPI0039A1A002
MPKPRTTPPPASVPPAPNGDRAPDVRGESAADTAPAGAPAADGTRTLERPPATERPRDVEEPGDAEKPREAVASGTAEGTAPAAGAASASGTVGTPDAGPPHSGDPDARTPSGPGPAERTGAAATDRAESKDRPDRQAAPPEEAPLLAREESDRLGRELTRVLSGFVDAPRESVEEADRVLEDVAARFTEAVNRRRSGLRASWETAEGEGDGSADTEQLRLALRDYRDLAHRLLRG